FELVDVTGTLASHEIFAAKRNRLPAQANDEPEEFLRKQQSRCSAGYGCRNAVECSIIQRVSRLFGAEKLFRFWRLMGCLVLASFQALISLCPSTKLKPHAPP